MKLRPIAQQAAPKKRQLIQLVRIIWLLKAIARAKHNSTRSWSRGQLNISTRTSKTLAAILSRSLHAFLARIGNSH
jgi:hypothetical protein